MKKIIQKTKEWRKIAMKQQDFFVKFALEYFCFNALLGITYCPDKIMQDRKLINKLKGDNGCKKYVLTNRKEWIEKLKDELDKKPLTNLTRKASKLKIESIEDWNNIVEAAYWIRNNLFHGHKYPGDERDQNLVKYGYHLISGFNEYFISITGERNAQTQMGN